MNNTTRKHPRNLQQAFGPYCTPYIEEPARPFDWEDKLVLWGCVLAVSAIGIIWCLT